MVLAAAFDISQTQSQTHPTVITAPSGLAFYEANTGTLVRTDRRPDADVSIGSESGHRS